MRVVLAGCNIDIQVLKEAERAGVARERLTPEVLSAAYARISRDPRPVGELRAAALEQVEQARASNRKIIFGMGHHSVAEHASFNFDLLGVSRLAIEALEHFRLCSFTEKSQRYITLDHDFVIPEELRGTPHEEALCSLVAAQGKLYERLHGALRQQLDRRFPDLTEQRMGRRLLDGWAKEDARYVTVLATSGQLGLTANARNLELIVRRFAAAPLAELRELGRRLHDQAVEYAPSLLLFTEGSRFDADTEPALGGLADAILAPASPAAGERPAVALVGHPEDGDRVIAAALLHRVSRRSFAECRAAVAGLDQHRLTELFHEAMRRMEFFDGPLREFEHVSLTFDVVVSASCFAQLKRHRMSTQSWQRYDPDLGLTIPPSVIEAGFAEEFEAHARRAEELYARLADDHPDAAPYVLTNAHRRRVLLTANLRELYHLIRLREDHHAQWDIRELAAGLRQAAEEVLPLGCLLLCGKDGYVDRYTRVFGRGPTIDPAKLDP